MLRLRRLVRDYSFLGKALGVIVYLRTVYWRNEAVHMKHLYISFMYLYISIRF